MTKSSCHLHVCQLAFHLWDCISDSLALASPDFTPLGNTFPSPGPSGLPSVSMKALAAPSSAPAPPAGHHETSLGSGSLPHPQMMDEIFKSQMALSPLSVTSLLSMFHVEVESVSFSF